MTDPTQDPAVDAACCPEFARVSRRGLFTGAAALVGSTTAFGSAVLTASAAHAASADAVLVVVSLRGAADGMSLVVPHGDPVYYQARPRIAVPKDSLFGGDQFFGLHPALRPLERWWEAGQLAAIHATGLRVPNRSHFSAMEEVEDADPGSSTRVGWLNRLVGADAIDSPLQAFGVGEGTPPGALVGPAPFLTGGSVDDIRIPGADQESFAAGRMRSLHSMWDRSRHPLAGSMRSVFRADTDFAPVRRTSASPANGARYDGDLGEALQAAARVVRGDVGAKVLTVDHGDWDHHTNVGTLEWGEMLRQAGGLAANLDAFLTDLGPTLRQKVTVVVLSEFGRRVRENANWGLDHGHGNVMFVLGAGVRGRRYYGTWPGLVDSHDADLPVTTDYRSVLWEIVAARFEVGPAAVFPRFTPGESLGFMTSA